MPKTWFITGASSGLGLEMTRQLLERGDRVVATVRRPGALAELQGEAGSNLRMVQLDVTDTPALRQTLADAFAELGRIDVSLELDKAGGKARAHLVVDRPETLALLQRDAGSLQQALAQAGFDVGAEAGGIDLSLRGETGSQGGRDGESASRGRSGGGPAGRDDGPPPLDPVSLRHLRAVSGLDIRI